MPDAPTPYPVPRIAAAFDDLVDPRTARAQRHRLLDILTIALCAVIGGEQTWGEIAEWAAIREAALTEWLGLRHGVPSHDTFGRVFARIDPAQFEVGFFRWVQQELPEPPVPDVLAIDGKTARQSGDRRQERSPLHLVSAYACGQRLVLTQEAVDAKENEILVLPRVLARLDLTDQIVTIDAMGCQKAIAQQIVDGGGEYVLALKENQPTLWEDVQDAFAMADLLGPVPDSTATTVDKGLGRLERRTSAVIADPATLAWLDPTQQWPGLRGIVRVTGTRDLPETVSPEPTDARYSLTSLEPDAQRIAPAVRRHWAIENDVHWVLDMVFREDESRVRVGHGTETLAVLRNLTLNLVRHDPHRGTRSIRVQRKRAGWDMTILSGILGLI